MCRCLVIGCLIVVGNLVCSSALAAESQIDFNRDIRPILAENCFKCHGFDPGARKAGLRLDDRDSATKPAESGETAIVPGKIAASELVRRINSGDEAVVMPPPDTGKKLKAEQIALLTRWIADGAKYAKHWSFEPPQKRELPPVKQAAWSRTDFDRFVLARLEREKLQPSLAAERTTLARRLALDITGLPPPRDDLAAFLADSSEQAYEKYVDTLLKSPAYGERWARPWLDLGRYADTKGYEKDLRRTIWRWRDWVIDSLNADMPYDQFTREQLAGDLLPNPTTDQLIATALHRNTMVNEEGGTDDEEFRIAAVKDRVDSTMQIWMGLTFGCAKCHTHKYDPIVQTEYYRFYAFFNQTEDADRGDDSPTIPTPTAAEQQRQADLKTQLAAAQQQLNRPTPELEAALPAWEEAQRKQLGWQVVRPSEMKAASGTALELQENGAVLVKGGSPAKETYTLTFAPAARKLTGLRLEALPDPSHPKGGVGRSPNDGNFVLSGIKLVLRTKSGDEQELVFAKAVADFAQKDYPIEHALKNPDPKKHGWAVSPKQTEARTAVFSLDKAIELPDDAQLVLTLDHQFEFSYPGFSIGKFRIAVSADDAPQLGPTLPDAVAAIVRKPASERTPEQQRQLLEYFATVAEQKKSEREEIAKLNQQLAGIKPVSTPILRELPEGKRRETKLHVRGNFLEPGEVVTAATPSALPAFPAGAPSNRLGVAQWLCSRENPLTARVAVNRLWAQLFGLGLVETQEDFGVQGTPPLHPELLDWLAVEFMENGWSQKRLLKSIVMSATYRQSSRATPELIERDRDNRLLARGPRFRLEAEMIRDQALAVAGLLSRKLHGPSVMPYQPEGLWKSTYNKDVWQTSPGEDRYRRGLYTFIKRTTPYPSMMTFDGTSRETCTIRRSRTNTPLQALVTLNDPVYVECAQALARKMSASSPQLRDQLAAGIQSVLLRVARPEELDALAGLYEQRLAVYQKDKTAATKLASEPLGPLPPEADAAQLAALTAVANVLLNLDEFLTKG